MRYGLTSGIYGGMKLDLSPCAVDAFTFVFCHECGSYPCKGWELVILGIDL